MGIFTLWVRVYYSRRIHRLLIVLFVLLILWQNLSNLQFCPIRNLRIFTIGDSDFPGITFGIDHRLLDLRIRHPNLEYLTIFHSNG